MTGLLLATSDLPSALQVLLIRRQRDCIVGGVIDVVADWACHVGTGVGERLTIPGAKPGHLLLALLSLFVGVCT
jgi:hypothetical protein